MLPVAIAVDERRGRVFVANKGPVDDNDVPIGNGTLSVLDARDGSILRTIPVGTYPATMAVDAHSGRVFVVNYYGTIQVAHPWWLQPAEQVHRVLPWLPLPRQPVPTTPSTGSVSVVDASG